MMKTTLYGAWLGALAIVAGCAQGLTSGADDAGPGTGADARGVGNGAEGGLVTQPPAGDDAGGGGPDDTGADDVASGGYDATADTGTPDTGFDSGGGPDTSVPDTSVPDTGGGGVPPTTCAQTNQGTGCCLGNNNYYCTVSNTVASKACTSGKVCGWSATNGYYDCVAQPGGTDPGGAPIACQ